MMVDKTVYMIRHGLIRSNVDGVYSGRSEESLTQWGAAQAEHLGREMQDWGVSAIYVSPLKRTVQTAEILNKYLGAKLIEEMDLIEMDLGPWTGLSKDDVARTFPEAYRTWVERPGEFRWDGMEDLGAIQERVVRFLDRFKDVMVERIAAVVTHAVVVKCAFLYCNELPLNSYHSIPAPNLSVHRLTINLAGCRMEKLR